MCSVAWSADVLGALSCPLLDDYIYLANTYMFVEEQTVADDNTALDGGEDVGPVNLLMHSFLSDVSVILNEKLVSPPSYGRT
jgi:hypothetical protein